MPTTHFVPAGGLPDQHAGEGAVLAHLGAFLWNVGIMMQEGPGLAPPPRQTKRRAKDELRDELVRLLNDLDTSNVSAYRKIREALRKIRNCNDYPHARAHGIINKLRGDAAMAPHKDRLDLSRLLSYLIMAKNLWQRGAPQFRYDPRRRRVQLIRNGVVIIEFTVAKGRAHQARLLVRDINRKFNACEYPTLGDAEKLQDLAAP